MIIWATRKSSDINVLRLNGHVGISSYFIRLLRFYKLLLLTVGIICLLSRLLYKLWSTLLLIFCFLFHLINLNHILFYRHSLRCLVWTTQFFIKLFLLILLYFPLSLLFFNQLPRPYQHLFDSRNLLLSVRLCYLIFDMFLPLWWLNWPRFVII